MEVRQHNDLGLGDDGLSHQQTQYDDVEFSHISTPLSP